MLKVEGIAFRFMPDPVQIKNALEVGVCVYRSDVFVYFEKIGAHLFILYLQDCLRKMFLMCIYTFY